MAATPYDVVVVGNARVDSHFYLGYEIVNFTIESNFTKNVDYVGQAGGYFSHGYA